MSKDSIQSDFVGKVTQGQVSEYFSDQSAHTHTDGKKKKKKQLSGSE